MIKKTIMLNIKQMKELTKEGRTFYKDKDLDLEIGLTPICELGGYEDDAEEEN